MPSKGLSYQPTQNKLDLLEDFLANNRIFFQNLKDMFQNYFEESRELYLKKDSSLEKIILSFQQAMEHNFNTILEDFKKDLKEMLNLKEHLDFLKKGIHLHF